MPSESDRTRLIAQLASLLHDCHLPEDARCASLTLIGYLARRMPGEAASTDGVEYARQQLDSHGQLKTCRAAMTAEISVRTRRSRNGDMIALEARSTRISQSVRIPRSSGKKLSSA
jgi:hypothetical protein